MNASIPATDNNNFFGAILNSERLTLIAHLSEREHTLQELAAVSHLNQKDILRHLEVLEMVDLVHEFLRDGKSFYRFNPKQIENLNRQYFSNLNQSLNLDSHILSKDQKKVVSHYTNQDGTLKFIPTKSKKIIAILEYISTSFESGVEYSEQEVNEILLRYHADTTTLRRYLIDYKYLGREADGSCYWFSKPEK
jgi:hypothetical protein